jgi:glycosyltransferase involved in cell wall biosynthesis
VRILQLCIRVPFPTVDGGSIAMYTMQKALVDNDAQLKVLSFNTIKQFTKLDTLPESYQKMTGIEAVYLDNRVKPFNAFLNLFTNESYHIIRFVKRDFEDLLQKTLIANEYDVIQLESLYMVPYIVTIKKLSKAKIVLRTHNIEHLIWERLANNEKSAVKKWYLNLLAKRLKSYEYWAFRCVDAIIALTKDDKNQMTKSGVETPIYIAPVGLDLSSYKCINRNPGNVIFHLGAMDWLPNQEGIEWFLEKVWPSIHQQFPNVKFKFAGKCMPDYLFENRSEVVQVDDFIEDSKEYMQSGDIMIVPIFSGSGMRVKIVEGMALGKAIVSTTIGLEGIAATDNQQVMIANSADEFIKAISYLLEHPHRTLEIGDEARKFAEFHFENKEIGRKLMNYYKELINN